MHQHVHIALQGSNSTDDGSFATSAFWQDPTGQYVDSSIGLSFFQDSYIYVAGNNGPPAAFWLPGAGPRLMP